MFENTKYKRTILINQNSRAVSANIIRGHHEFVQLESDALDAVGVTHPNHDLAVVDRAGGGHQAKSNGGSLERVRDYTWLV